MSAKRGSTTSPPPLPKKPKNGARGKLDATSKAALAEEIVLIGIAGVQSNMETTSQKTGLSAQQIRSQLADNRANLRRALLEVAKKVE